MSKTLRHRIVLLMFLLLVLSISTVSAQVLRAVTPTNPDVDAVPGAGFVKLYWSATPESDIDTVLQKLYPDDPERWNNFEGYKVYRATDHEFQEVFTITDGLGELRYYKPLVVFDQINQIKGYFQGNSGLGIPLIFTNTSENTFDTTLPPFYPDIQPMESNASLYGESSNGSWKLHITDTDTSKNIGQLVEWKIAFKDADSQSYGLENSGTIEALNIVENSAFDRYEQGNDSSPLRWERYQPESMFFKKTQSDQGETALEVEITDFWERGSKNRLDNGDFEEAADTSGWDQLSADADVHLDWIQTHADDSTGWLQMGISTDTKAGLRWNIKSGNQFDPNSWVAISIQVGSDDVPAEAQLYLELNNGSEARVNLGAVPADTTFWYYRRVNNRLTSVSVYATDAGGSTLYFNCIKATTAEYLTQEVYQRLPRVVAGSHYVWETRIYENDPSISVTPGYRAYLPNQAIEEFRQHGIEDTDDSPDYQNFRRSFDAPEETRDGIFYYRVDVIADEWTGSAGFILDSLKMVGNSKWGLNLYPQVSSEIEVEGAVTDWDDFRITLDIDHGWLYELNIELEGPSGDRFTLMDGEFARSFLDGGQGIAQYLGDDTGIEYTYIDTTVNNGQQYFYAVVAFDHGDSLYNILPAEGDMKIEIEDGRYVFSNNTVSVIPNPPTKGYAPPSLNEPGIVHEGYATGSVSVEIVDDRKILDDASYEIYFYDTSTDPQYELSSTVDFFAKKTTAYGVRNVASGDTLLDYITTLDQPSTVFDGLRLRLDNPGRFEIVTDSTRWSGSDISHPEVLINLSDLGGHRFPVRYRITFYDEVVDTSERFQQAFIVLNPRPVNMQIHDLMEDQPVRFGYRPVSGTDDYILYPLFADTLDNVTNPVNFPYKTNWYIKLIFNGPNIISNKDVDKGGIYHWQDADSTISYERVSGFSDRPFGKITGEATKLFWDEATPKPSPADPVFVVIETDTVYAPGLYYFHGWFKASSDQILYFGQEVRDTSFTVTGTYTEFTVPLELTEPGKLRIAWESVGDDQLWSYGLSISEKYRIREGDALDVATTIQYRSTDTYQFSTVAAQSNATEEQDWSDFSVVPNPYILSASWDYSPDLPGDFPNKVSFINVPEDAVLRIYTVRGDLVRKLDHDRDIFNGSINWDLKNESGEDVAYGIYIYHIKSRKLGDKTGKLAVIR